MNEPNINSVEAAKWAWKAGGGKLASKKPMDIKLKAVIQAAVMIAVGSFLFFKRHHIIAPAIVGILAAVVLIGGLFVPPLFRAIDKFFSVTLVKWVGTGLTYLFLVPFYFLVFAPAHLILNARRIDPMAREFPTKLGTYWIQRKPVATAQYKRQH